MQWSDFRITQSNHCDDYILWVKGSFYCYAKTLTAANQIAESLLQPTRGKNDE